MPENSSSSANTSEAVSLVSQLKCVNLVSGKGGVGKTTLAATFARASAAQGKKTLLAELEDESGWDSPLARNFNKKRFSQDAVEIGKNLEGISLSARFGQEQFLTSFLKVSSLSHLIMNSEGVQWFLDGAPAFKEMGYFYHLLLQLRKNYDVIVLDLPATGHLIGLARLPRLLLKMIPFGPIADRLREGQKILYDPKLSAAWIVTLPQTLPVSESIELKNALTAEQLPVGGFVLNRAPFNPFTTEEEALLEKSESTSSIEVARIRRLREARKRLEEEYAGHVWIAPEVLNPSEDPNFGLKITRS